jgi:hypothetical protein
MYPLARMLVELSYAEHRERLRRAERSWWEEETLAAADGAPARRRWWMSAWRRGRRLAHGRRPSTVSNSERFARV